MCDVARTCGSSGRIAREAAPEPLPDHRVSEPNYNELPERDGNLCSVYMQMHMYMSACKKVLFNRRIKEGEFCMQTRAPKMRVRCQLS